MNLQSTLNALPQVYGESMHQECAVPNTFRAPFIYLHGSIEEKNGYDIFVADEQFIKLKNNKMNFICEMNFQDGSKELCICIIDKEVPGLASGLVVSLQELDNKTLYAI